MANQSLLQKPPQQTKMPVKKEDKNIAQKAVDLLKASAEKKIKEAVAPVAKVAVQAKKSFDEGKKQEAARQAAKPKDEEALSTKATKAAKEVFKYALPGVYAAAKGYKEGGLEGAKIEYGKSMDTYVKKMTAGARLLPKDATPEQIAQYKQDQADYMMNVGGASSGLIGSVKSVFAAKAGKAAKDVAEEATKATTKKAAEEVAKKEVKTVAVEAEKVAVAEKKVVRPPATKPTPKVPVKAVKTTESAPAPVVAEKVAPTTPPPAAVVNAVDDVVPQAPVANTPTPIEAVPPAVPAAIPNAVEDVVTTVPKVADAVPPAPPIEPPKPPLGSDGAVPPPEPPASIVKPPMKPGETEQVFKTERLLLNADEEVQIGNRLKALGLETRTIRNNKELQDAAQELGVNPTQLLKEVKSSRINDEEVAALSQLLTDNNRFITNATKQLADDPRLELVLAPQIKQAERQVDIALKKLIKGGTEAGRAVQAFSLLSRESMDPTFWQLQAKKQLGNRMLTNDMSNMINDLIAKSDRNGLASFIAGMRNASRTEKAVTLWKAGLLSAPTTHMANLGGNVLMQVLGTASDLAAVPFDVLASLATGNRTALASMAPTIAQIKGMGHGARRGVEFFKTGVYPADMVAKFDIPREVTFKTPLINRYVKTVFRTLGATDIMFREAAMQKSFVQQAQIMAKSEKLTGAAFKKRVADLLVKPTNDMYASAINAAEYATFQDKTTLGRQAAAWKKAGTGNAIAELAGELIMPFTQTPTSIASKLVDHSPAGFIKALARAIKPATRSQENLVKDLSRAVTGTGVMALGALLFQKGIMTGNAPETEAERKQWQAEGKQANSIKINGHWINLTKLAPAGNMLAIGADFERLSKDKDGLDLATSASWNAVRGLTNMTFLKGVAAGTQALNQPDRYGEAFFEGVAGGLVPNVIAKTERAFDPRLRDPEGVGQSIMSRIPLLDQNVPVRKDIFGRDIEAPGGRLALIDPFGVTKATTDPSLLEMERIGYSVGVPSPKIAGMPLDNEQYAEFQGMNGKALKKVVDKVIESDQYQKLPTDKKKDLLDQVVSEVRSIVRDVYLPKMIIKKYDLPPDTNPALLQEASSILYDSEDFIKMNEKEKEAALGRVFRKLTRTTASPE